MDAWIFVGLATLTEAIALTIARLRDDRRATPVHGAAPGVWLCCRSCRRPVAPTWTGTDQWSTTSLCGLCRLAVHTCTCIGHTPIPGAWVIDVPDPACPTHTHTPAAGDRRV